jgi:hypothetical protein
MDEMWKGGKLKQAEKLAGRSELYTAVASDEGDRGTTVISLLFSFLVRVGVEYILPILLAYI